MTRLFLLVLLGIAATYYLPDSRQMLSDWAAPVTNRLVAWSTKEEMRGIATAVIEHEQRTGELPDRRSWQGWLDWRYPVKDGQQDPWGNTYQIRAWADSVAIISYGPDLDRGTEDDFQVVVPRERRR